MTPSPPAAASSRIWLAIALTAAALVSACWAWITPIFQSADEDTHLDYALTLYSAGRPLRTCEAPVAAMTRSNPFIPVTHPGVWYLSVQTNLHRIRHRPEARMPAGYGSIDYFRQLQSGAPRGPRAIARLPWVITRYPVGYYGALALWLAFLGRLNDGLVFLFFAARAFSVLMLPIALALLYAAARELRLAHWRAVVLVAAIGLFPLTSFVSSYVQPDNLGFLLVCGACCFGMRARRELVRGAGTRNLFGLGATLGLLMVTKVHFFACIALPVIAMLLAEQATVPRPHRRWLAPIGCLMVSALAFGGLQLWVGGSEQVEPAYVQAAGTLATLGPIGYLVAGLRSACENFFGGGTTFRSFWGTFGWVDTPLVFGSPDSDAVVKLGQAAFTYLVIGLALLRSEQVLTRLIVIARRGKRVRAVRLALSNPLLNGLGCFTVAMFGVYVGTSNAFLAQGRNWFPFLGGIFWLALLHAPRALSHPRARRVALDAALCLALAYSVAANYFALRSIAQRFYGQSTSSRAEPGR